MANQYLHPPTLALNHRPTACPYHIHIPPFQRINRYIVHTTVICACRHMLPLEVLPRSLNGVSWPLREECSDPVPSRGEVSGVAMRDIACTAELESSGVWLRWATSSNAKKPTTELGQGWRVLFVDVVGGEDLGCRHSGKDTLPETAPIYH